MFCLDYIACGKNVPERISDIVKGVCDGCVQAGAALIGGETAEMPGFYPENEYDLAGYCTGIVDEEKVIDNKTMREGDVIIALPSSGVHSNGFSLVRKVFDIESEEVKKPVNELGGRSLLEALLVPTAIYVKPVLDLIEKVAVKGISHITGGGFYENIPRSVPAGLCAVIEKKSVKTPALFSIIQQAGGIPERDMFNTFNMGVGMSVVVKREDAETALNVLKSHGVEAYVIGEIAKAEERICLC